MWFSNVPIKPMLPWCIFAVRGAAVANLANNDHSNENPHTCTKALAAFLSFENRLAVIGEPE